MNPSINLSDWHSVLQDAIYWQDLHPDYAILLYKNVRRAYLDGLTYHVKDPVGGEIDLTKIYEQFKMLATLRAEY
jgi:hypothetical protein